MEIIISAFISASYATLMIWLLYGIFKLKPFHLAKEPLTTSFSICIPFRNEAENLPRLLQSLQELEYNSALFEILLLNDCSADNSVKIVEEFIQQHAEISIQLLHNPAKAISPKKEALSKAVQHSTKEYIVTTDADCEVPKKWLQYFNAMIVKQQPHFIAGPVSYSSSKSFLDKFQTLDFLSLQAATLGGFGHQQPFLCNGANLCYKKESFLEVNGFEDDKIASGDDIFLLEKMQFAKKKISYLANFEAKVKTVPPQNFSTLLQQRIRWAAKTSAYKNKTALYTAIIVFLTNLAFLILLTGVLFQSLAWQAFVLLFIIKFNLDFFVLYKTADFYKQPELMKSYMITAFIHPFFIVAPAFLSFVKSYNWKGRNFKK